MHKLLRQNFLRIARFSFPGGPLGEKVGDKTRILAGGEAEKIRLLAARGPKATLEPVGALGLWG